MLWFWYAVGLVILAGFPVSSKLSLIVLVVVLVVVAAVFLTGDLDNLQLIWDSTTQASVASEDGSHGQADQEQVRRGHTDQKQAEGSQAHQARGDQEPTVRQRASRPHASYSTVSHDSGDHRF